MDEKIDFVVLWVDGSDSEWLKEKNKYKLDKNDLSNSENRYRDWGMLKYWFRGIEKYAPWVNKIHFVTWGHVPKWLNLSNPKLNIVKHEDFIPKEYLPTFNSNVIQYYIHKIPNLSEKFIMFDDDMFIINNVKKTDFFRGNNICDVYGEKPFWYSKIGDKYPHCLLNNMQVINQYYSKRKVYAKNIFKYFNYKYGLEVNLKNLLLLPFNEFTGIYSQHICQAYTKKYFEKFWKLCGKELSRASENRFRDNSDYSTFLVRYLELLDGCFVPRNKNFGKRFEISNNNKKIRDAIIKQKYKIICINDSNMDYEFNNIKKEIEDSFEIILSKKSSFEL